MAKRGPKPKPLVQRLLSKISVTGVLDTQVLAVLIGHPVVDWPDTIRAEPWIWTASRSKAKLVTQLYRRRGKVYTNLRRPKPCFGGGEPHRLLYEIFLGKPEGSVYYYMKPANNLDVNPAHWVARRSKRSHPSIVGGPPPIDAPWSHDEFMENADDFADQYRKCSGDGFREFVFEMLVTGLYTPFQARKLADLASLSDQERLGARGAVETAITDAENDTTPEGGSYVPTDNYPDPVHAQLS